MHVKALQKGYYDRRDRMPGEVYEMDDREADQAKLLSILGKIEILPVGYITRAMKVEEPKQQQLAEQPVEQPVELPSTEVAPMTTDSLTPRNRYRRRDMRAAR